MFAGILCAWSPVLWPGFLEGSLGYDVCVCLKASK